MAPISEPKIQRLKIEHIDADGVNRLRPATQSGVDSLKASIDELGVIKDAIHVRQIGRGDNKRLVLMAGLHRLTAAIQLGWDTIPARVWVDVSDNFARLMEIDDNLAGADLSPLELSVFLAARKKVYEAEHPEATAAAFKGNRHTGKLAVEIISFARSVSEKREISDRHIRNFVQIGQTLSPFEVQALREAKKPVRMSELMQLVKIPEDHIRVDVIDRLKHGTSETVKAAWDTVAGRTAPPEMSREDKAYLGLFEAWKRAPKAAKRRFAEEIADDLAGLGFTQ